ncbi:MAG: hypothetical protein K2I19_02535 [Muribaculaceae bacterium]|nr:hypothetical protein [Muribaculaceae bacterium]
MLLYAVVFSHFFCACGSFVALEIWSARFIAITLWWKINLVGFIYEAVPHRGDAAQLL